MNFGELVTKLTIWLSVAGYLITLGTLLVCSNRSRSVLNFARNAWTVGFIAMVLHVAAAFHFFHAWSHARATAQTALETAAVVGWDWGGGIWFNYCVLVIWLVDALWWWVNPPTYQNRPAWISAIVHLYLAFMFFNAVVIFETGLLRWLGITAIAVFCVMWWSHRAAKS